MTIRTPSFQVYRGLQKPLVFKSFKGRYIYWGLGSIFSGLLGAMLVASLVHLLAGLLTMTVILGVGLGITAWFQQRGTKPHFHGIVYIPNHPIIQTSQYLS